MCINFCTALSECYTFCAPHHTAQQHSGKGFERFDALQMRGDVFELVGLLFVPDDFIVMMQCGRAALIIQRLIVTRQDHQAAVAVFLTKIADALGGDIEILFRPVDLAFHVFVRETGWD